MAPVVLAVPVVALRVQALQTPVEQQLPAKEITAAQVLPLNVVLVAEAVLVQLAQTVNLPLLLVLAVRGQPQL
jgi:hypothetical protein